MPLRAAEAISEPDVDTREEITEVGRPGAVASPIQHAAGHRPSKVGFAPWMGSARG